MGLNSAEATKNIYIGKSESTVDHSTVNWWINKFCWGCKTLDDQARSGRPKTMDSEAMFQAKEMNSATSTQKVSGEFSSPEWYVTFTTLAKASLDAELKIKLPKYWKLNSSEYFFF